MISLTPDLSFLFLASVSLATAAAVAVAQAVARAIVAIIGEPDAEADHTDSQPG